MALLRRLATGEGDYLDVAMFDACLAWTPNVTGRVFATGQPHVPKDERSWGGNAMFNLYETADGRWIVLGGAEEKFARNLLEALGRPDLLPFAKLPPGPGQEPLRAFLRDTFRTKSRAEWEAWMAGRDVCFAPVRDMVEAFADPHVTERGMLARDPNGNEIVGTPLKFLHEPGTLNPAVPALGASASAILTNLGYSADDIQRLRDQGVIGH
jgi:crotonobetainyl-CoA:carnitine CoA-transferase CaiB-like acyl-CoA transferase